MKNRLPQTALFLLVLYFVSCNNQTPDKETVPKTDTALSKKPLNDPFLKNGEETTRYPNGVIQSKGFYKNGKREGSWLSWYNSGKPWSETFFDNGNKNGATKTWYENGKLRYQGQFKNDKEAGTWQYFDEAGKPVKTIDYDKK